MRTNNLFKNSFLQTIYLQYIYTYIYIYIYIYIYCHPWMNCFVVSKIFKVAKHTRCFKLGLKPRWFYVTWISYPRAIIILSVMESFTNIFLQTRYQQSGWSIHEKHLAFMWQLAISHSSAQPAAESIYIIIHRQTVARHTEYFKLGSKPGWLYVRYLTPELSSFAA